MILIGDTIRRWNDTTSWVVHYVTDVQIHVHDAEEPRDTCVFPAGGTFDDNGKLMPYTIVSLSDCATTPNPGDDSLATIERLAYNCGAMEFELFMVWRRLNGTLESMDGDGQSWSMGRMASIIESIEAMADRLKPRLMLDGTVETPYLKESIYANRK